MGLYQKSTRATAISDSQGRQRTRLKFVTYHRQSAWHTTRRVCKQPCRQIQADRENWVHRRPAMMSTIVRCSNMCPTRTQRSNSGSNVRKRITSYYVCRSASPDPKPTGPRAHACTTSKTHRSRVPPVSSHITTLSAMECLMLLGFAAWIRHVSEADRWDSEYPAVRKLRLDSSPTLHNKQCEKLQKQKFGKCRVDPVRVRTG